MRFARAMNALHPLLITGSWGDDRTDCVQVAPFCVQIAARLRAPHDPGRYPFVVPASVRRSDDRPRRDPGRAEAAVAGGASTGFPFR
jgi:hypothetical protein